MKCKDCKNVQLDDKNEMHCEMDICYNSERELLKDEILCRNCKFNLGEENRENINGFVSYNIFCYADEIPYNCNKYTIAEIDSCGECFYSNFSCVPITERGEIVYCCYNPQKIRKRATDWCGKFQQA